MDIPSNSPFSDCKSVRLSYVCISVRLIYVCISVRLSYVCGLTVLVFTTFTNLNLVKVPVSTTMNLVEACSRIHWDTDKGSGLHLNFKVVPISKR